MFRRRGPSLILSLLFVLSPLTAGCLGGDDAEAVNETSAQGVDRLDGASPTETGVAHPRSAGEVDPSSLGPARPTAVIADIGPGVNPYHEAFRRPGWTAPPSHHIAGFPANATALPLTLGTEYKVARQADDDLWAGYQNKTLYWVPGTNLLLYTHRPPSMLPDGNDRTFHGTGTAHAAALACPDCYVLVYQDAASLDGAPTFHIADEMPWVDVVTSTNFPGDPFTETFLGRYAFASRALHESGRIQFGFAGNSPLVGTSVVGISLAGVGGPVPAPYPHMSLPPWTVPVGGAHGACNAVEGAAGKPPELVGDFTQTLAWSGSVSGTRTVSGTSYSTPQLAGSFAAIVQAVRAELGPGTGVAGTLWSGEPVEGNPYLEDGALVQEEVRDALHRAAVHFATVDYQAPCERGLAPVPASPTPWADMGWGYVGPDETTRAVAMVLGGTDLTERPMETREAMAAHQEARVQFYAAFMDLPGAS